MRQRIMGGLAFVLMLVWGAPSVSAGAQAPQEAVVLSREEIALPAPEKEEAMGAEAVVANGERDTVAVPVISWRDLPFQTVKRQAFDYSCGSAAVATLMSYVYGAKTSETDVFKEMFDKGDQEKIRREGFSLLDMSRYLARRGYRATGYKLDFARAEKAGVPFIALIDNDGYHHFVVVKSVRGNAVLVGDPNKGNIVYAKASFEKRWNGIALIVMNHARQARAVFADAKDWRYARYPAQPDNSALAALGDLYEAPRNTQIAPVGFDILTNILNVTGGISQIAVQTR